MLSSAARSPLGLFLFVTFAVSWAIWALLFVPIDLTGDLRWMLYYAGVIGPAAAAFICARADTAVSRDMLVQRLRRWRFSVAWYAIGILLPFVIQGLALVTTILVSSDDSWRPILRPGEAIMRVALLLLLLVPFEEIGWRGYLLPLLQQRYTPLISSLIVALVWALWHFPLAWAPVGYQQTDGPWTYMLRFAITIVPISCLATWLFNRTGESIVSVSLFHLAVDLADYVVVFPEGIGETVLWITTLLNAVVVALIWRLPKAE